MNGQLARMCKKSAGVTVGWHKHDKTKEKHMNSMITVIGLLMTFEPGSSQWSSKKPKHLTYQDKQ